MERIERPAPDAGEARDALRLVSATQADLADRLITPWWYHPGLGLIIAGLVVTLALPLPSKGLLLIVALAGLAGLVTAYSRVTGLGFSSEYTKLAFRELVALTGLILVAMLLVLAVPQPAVIVPAALFCLVATIVLGRRADETMRRKLREQASR